MALPLFFGSPLRTIAISLLANDWLNAKNAEQVRLQRIRICVGVALFAIGAYAAWERKREKESIAIPGFMSFLGANIVLDGWRKIQTTYQRTIRNLR